MSRNKRSGPGIKSGKPVKNQSPGQGKTEKPGRAAGQTPGDYVEGILSGKRAALSRAITLVESTLRKDGELAQEIIARCLPRAGKSIRIGVTGVPGVGKSTFIEAFGLYLTRKLKKTVAVLAIDPTSELSKGSILGDKIRMDELSQDPNAFIRPSPSSGSLGGVAKNTRETIILCEAAGFNTIIVETVGVGQSETSVRSMVDFFLLLMLAGAGAELQGIKRGIMEMADAVAITKSDGTNRERALFAKNDFQNALQLYPPQEGGWIPPVTACSSINNEGIEEIWGIITEHRRLMEESGQFEKKRRGQAVKWMHETVLSEMKGSFYSNEKIRKVLPGIEKEVAEGRMSPFSAGQELLGLYFGK